MERSIARLYRHALGLIEAAGDIHAGLDNLTAIAGRYRLGAAMDSSDASRREHGRAADWLAGVISTLEDQVTQ